MALFVSAWVGGRRVASCTGGIAAGATEGYGRLDLARYLSAVVHIDKGFKEMMQSENQKRLKFYVWTDFCPDYTSGLAVAIAYDESQARKLVQDSYGGEPYDWGKLNVYDIELQAFCVCGGG